MAPTTRWHGTTIGSGLRPLAAPDGTGLAGVAEAPGLLAVTDRLAVGDRAQRLPGGELELRAVGGQRHVERLPVAGEVLVELGSGLRQDRVIAGRGVLGRGRRRQLLVGQVDLDEGIVVGDERDRADRTVDGRAMVHNRVLSQR